MPNPYGQIVNRSHSGGLTVAGMWCKLFVENEAAFRTGRFEAVRTDDQMTEAMLAAFPDRGESKVMRQVRKLRAAYNRGALAGQRSQPSKKDRSFRYELDPATKKLVRISPCKSSTYDNPEK